MFGNDKTPPSWSQSPASASTTQVSIDKNNIGSSSGSHSSFNNTSGASNTNTSPFVGNGVSNQGQFMSFPKQSMANPTFIDGVASSVNANTNIFNTAGRQTTPSLETRNPFAPTHSFQSPSLGRTTFQPNSFLSRPSPKSSSSPSNSFLNHNQQLQANNDLASTMGLRRRANVNSGAATGGIIMTNRPPLPNATRLGTSLDLPDDFKENFDHKKLDTLNKHQNQIVMNKSTSPLVNISNNTKQHQPPQAMSNVNMTKFSSTSYTRWVTVYGFTNSIEYTTIMKSFESYGTIIDKYPSTLSCDNFRNCNRSGSSSNWVCLQYRKEIHADKAFCQHGSLVHVVGGDTDRNMSNTINSYACSSAQNDKIVIVGVMQMNENLAMKLGLKNYLETGNTGVEKISSGSLMQLVESEAESTEPRGSDSKKKTVTFATSIMNEDDILLFANDTKTQMIRYEDASICGKVLAWFFSW